MIRYQLKITDIVEEASGTNTFLFDKPEDFTWQEGSHTHIGHLGFDAGEMPNKAWVRHMSISTLPSEGKVGITTRVPGSRSEFKNKLSELKAGDEVVLFKLGSRMFLRRSGRPIVLLSMGVGIATMRPIILAYLTDKTGIPSIVNVNVDSSREFVFRRELDGLVDTTFSSHWLNSRKAYYDLLPKLAGTGKPIFYLVGSDDFLKDAIQRLRACNVEECDIIIDKKDEKLLEYFA